MVLDVGSTVTSVSPMSASIKGGTLLTITGTNFGTAKTDNPVQISYNGGVGSTHCFVQTTESTKITCRIDETVNKTAGTTGTVVVFLKTSEEAKCDISVCGSFTYTDTIPKVTEVKPIFDEASGTWEVELTGTGFTGTPNNVEFFVGSTKQTTKSVEATKAYFTINDVTDLVLKKSKVFFEVGLPEGKELVAQDIMLTPKFTGISPVSGSVGGSIITATVPGVGKSTTGLDFVLDDRSSICQSVTISKYGQVDCHTKAIEITN